MPTPVKDSRTFAFNAFLAASLAAGVYLLAVYAAAGSGSMHAIFKVGPASTRSHVVFALCACWILIGVALTLLQWPRLISGHGLYATLFVLLAFHHLNILREPHGTKTGDFGVYWKAAQCVEAGKPLPNCYICPPLRASVLQPFMRLGVRRASNYFKMTNYAAVLISYLLLYLLLPRYGFSRCASAVLPFVVNREWRWLAFFAAAQTAVVALTWQLWRTASRHGLFYEGGAESPRVGIQWLYPPLAPHGGDIAAPLDSLLRGAHLPVSRAHEGDTREERDGSLRDQLCAAVPHPGVRPLPVLVPPSPGDRAPLPALLDYLPERARSEGIAP